MTFKADLLWKGYFPENLPPPFVSENIGNFFATDLDTSDYLSKQDRPLRCADYSASKRGTSRRTFSVVHPETAHDLAQFLETHAAALDERFSVNNCSFSRPRRTPNGERAIEISSHNELEAERLKLLSGYRFIAKTDTSRFYHSVYTHSIPWAFHGRAAAKKSRKADAKDVYFNRLDFIVRQGQDGQTIGIPVGPDASRYIAELVSHAVDSEFVAKCGKDDVTFIRHVDDVWIGAQSQSEVERALSVYRNCLRRFELDINESKTHVYSTNFRFTEFWPTDIGGRIDSALDAPEKRREERLRAALEYAFDLASTTRDDGILKYTIRLLDRSKHDWDEWPVLQPFLMRLAVHFGHTLDFIVQILVWRKVTKDDLDEKRWAKIINSLLDHHGRLGNDSEVCWLIYAAGSLQISVPEEVGINIVKNCGALSIVAAMNLYRMDSTDVFDAAYEIIANDSSDGAMWPVFLEWAGTQWHRAKEVKGLIANDLIKSMSERQVYVFEADRRTRVFAGVEESKFSDIPHAIGWRTSSYDDEAEA
jgi:hypothetical protein